MFLKENAMGMVKTGRIPTKTHLMVFNDFESFFHKLRTDTGAMSFPQPKILSLFGFKLKIGPVCKSWPQKHPNGSVPDFSRIINAHVQDIL